MRLSPFVLLILLQVVLHGQPYQTSYPAYDPIPYTGIFNLGDRIYRVGLHNVMEMTTNHGQDWLKLTPSVPVFNIVHASSSGHIAVALLNPMRLAPDGWEDSVSTSVLLFRYSETSPQYLRVPWLAPGAPNHARRMFCDVNHDAIFIIQLSETAALLRSTDLGVSWEELGLPDSLDKNRECIVEFYDSTRGFLIGVSENMNGNSLYVTFDGGKQWHRSLSGLKATAGLLIPQVPPCCWVSKDTVLIVDKDNNILISTDGGLTWAIQSDNLNMPDVTDLHLVGDNGFIACNGGMIARTVDMAKSFTIVRNSTYGVLSGPAVHLCISEEHTILAVDEYGACSRSTDSGTSWEDERFQQYWQPYRLHLFSMDTVFAQVYATSNVDSYRYIRTTDGGVNWTLCADVSNADWQDIYFANPMIWYAIRRPTLNDSTIVARSDDGGVSWKSVYRNSSIDMVRIPRGVCAHGTDNFWFATRNFFLATSDGGNSWREISPDTTYKIPDYLYFVNDKTICFLNSKTYMRTTDGGLSWSRFPGPDQNFGFRSLIVCDDGRQYLYALDFALGCYRLWKSLNEGEHWDTVDVHQNNWIRFTYIDTDGSGCGLMDRNGEQFVSTTDEWRNYNVEGGLYNQPCWSLYFLNAKEGYATSKLSILKTTNGGINWTNVTPIIPESSRILSTWPQPVAQGGTMNTEVELTRPGPVRIELYDLLGRRRAEVFDAEVEAGRRTVRWPASGLDRGVYILRLLTSNGAASSKVVVQ